MALFGEAKKPDIDKLLKKRKTGDLVKALRYEKDSAVPKAAAEALKQLGWKPSKDEDGAWYYIETDRIIECVNIGAPSAGPLLAVLDETVPGTIQMRCVAARMLASFGDKRAVMPLIKALDNDNSELREASAEALWKIGGDPRAVDSLRNLLEDESEDVREWANKALYASDRTENTTLLEIKCSDDIRDNAMEVALALKSWYRDNAIAWWKNSGKDHGICDDGNEYLEKGEGYLRPAGNYLCCEGCTNAILNLTDWGQVLASLGNFERWFGSGLPEHIKGIVIPPSSTTREQQPDGKGVNVKTQKETKAEEDISSPVAIDEKQIEKLLRKHFARLTSELKLPPGADSPTTVFKDLLKSDCLTFTVDTIGQNLGRSLQQKQVLSDTAFIGEYFVAVTTCPWLNVDEVRSHLSGGYVQFLDGLTKFSMGPNRKPIAHWIFCSNGDVHCAHLTLIPNPNTRVPTILATDLLGPSEKQQLNMT